MKFAAYTEETIWAVADDEETARSEGEETMAENGSTDTAALKVAPSCMRICDCWPESKAAKIRLMVSVASKVCRVERTR